jgi:fructose-1-phosphate kinase PfkB-like protein
MLSGSLPRQAAPDTYARLIRNGRRHGVLSVLDCDGASLAAAVGARPLLIKPNEFELSQWAGATLRTDAAFMAAARKMSLATQGWVMVSRGGKGAVLVNAREKVELLAAAPTVETLNTLGAGDALLAGAVSQLITGRPPEEWLRWGVASGTASAQMSAGVLPSLAMVRRVSAGVRIGGRESTPSG